MQDERKPQWQSHKNVEETCWNHPKYPENLNLPGKMLTYQDLLKYSFPVI